MNEVLANTEPRLLAGGSEVFGCMLEAIAAARQSIQLETYIWRPGQVGERFLDALLTAVRRGVQVHLLLDAFGCDELPGNYFATLTGAGARLRWFNPKRLLRLTFRNHRKLLIVDQQLAVVGGLNIADEYDGDGIARGWRDVAVEVHGPVVADLHDSFVRMSGLARFSAKALRAFARRNPTKPHDDRPATLLVSGPGSRTASLQRTLRADLLRGRDVAAYAAYLLPTTRMRRALRAATRSGGVRIITGARTDVPLMRWAAQRLYPYWLRHGVRLYEYQPQVMHAKLIVIDDLLLRIRSAALAADVRAAVDADIARSNPVELQSWRAARRWWQPLRSWVAYQLLMRLDPYLARDHLRRLS
jgi:cardiolipin synthase